MADDKLKGAVPKKENPEELERARQSIVYYATLMGPVRGGVLLPFQQMEFMKLNDFAKAIESSADASYLTALASLAKTCYKTGFKFSSFDQLRIEIEKLANFDGPGKKSISLYVLKNLTETDAAEIKTGIIGFFAAANAKKGGALRIEDFSFTTERGSTKVDFQLSIELERASRAQKPMAVARA
ncbi:MAG: hypothetical protein WCT31_03925 [Candidatus Micrarchaeia archaeon]